VSHSGSCSSPPSLPLRPPRPRSRRGLLRAKETCALRAPGTKTLPFPPALSSFLSSLSLSLSLASTVALLRVSAGQLSSSSSSSLSSFSSVCPFRSFSPLLRVLALLISLGISTLFSIFRERIPDFLIATDVRARSLLPALACSNVSAPRFSSS